MNDEIKEILYVLKHIVIGRASRLTPREAQTLLDYITNLQQENERLKELNKNASKVCMAEHRYGVDKAEEARDYKSRCKKASEYIGCHFKDMVADEEAQVVLSILQNGSDSQ